MDGVPPDTAGLQPLGDAAIWVFHDPADTAAKNPDTLLWVNRDTSAADGSFHAASTAAPFNFTAVLRVRRAGYRGLDVPFTHDTLRHRAVVVLTPVPHGPTNPPR